MRSRDECDPEELGTSHFRWCVRFHATVSFELRSSPCSRTLNFSNSHRTSPAAEEYFHSAVFRRFTFDGFRSINRRQRALRLCHLPSVGVFKTYPVSKEAARPATFSKRRTSSSASGLGRYWKRAIKNIEHGASAHRPVKFCIHRTGEALKADQLFIPGKRGRSKILMIPSRISSSVSSNFP